jgi:hypothetical protein
MIITRDELDIVRALPLLERKAYIKAMREYRDANERYATAESAADRLQAVKDGEEARARALEAMGLAPDEEEGDGLECVLKLSDLTRDGKNVTVFFFGRRDVSAEADGPRTRVDIYEGDPDLGDAKLIDRKES